VAVVRHISGRDASPTGRDGESLTLEAVMVPRILHDVSFHHANKHARGYLGVAERECVDGVGKRLAGIGSSGSHQRR
jgi:hypothetical protein